MDWLFKLLELAFVTGQIAACLYLAYGAYLSLAHSSDKPEPELSGGVHRFGAIASAQRAQHRGEMRLDRAFGYVQLPGDDLVGFALDDAAQDVHLPRRQAG